MKRIVIVLAALLLLLPLGELARGQERPSPHTPTITPSEGNASGKHATQRAKRKGPGSRKKPARGKAQPAKPDMAGEKAPGKPGPR